MSPRLGISTGKPLGRPPGTGTPVPYNSFCKTRPNFDSLVAWMASGVPRRLILEYCAETGIKVPGTKLGEQMQSLANFRKLHGGELAAVQDTFRATAREDAIKRRDDFLDEIYSTRDLIRESMFTDRDSGGRTHQLREYTQICALIADIEGFKKQPQNEDTRKFLDGLLTKMLNPGTIDAEVTVLEAK